MSEELLAILPKLLGKKVLVVGDVCLDEYIVGRPRRLSREAAIPVLEFQDRFVVPGAAANPALNIRGLGAEASLISAIGDDEAGRSLNRKLEESGIDTVGLVVDAGRQTTVKTRILAEASLRFPQQVARVDRVDRHELGPQTREHLVAHLSWVINGADAVLLSDYKNGVIDDGLTNSTVELARASGKIITVDSQGDLLKFRGFTVAKCNQQEAETVLRRELDSDDDFATAGRFLLDELKAEAVLITRGSEGMSLSYGEGLYEHIPAANVSEVFDVTGAGDTVIAVLTLALAAGATISQAAHLANYAAGLVVRKLGNAVPISSELRAAIRNH